MMTKTNFPEVDLEASPLLPGVDDRLRSLIFGSVVERPLAEGEPLMVEGRPNDHLWFVVGGSVSVERTRPGGKVDVLARLNGPALYGTSTFFRGTAPSATIRASEPIEAFVMTRAACERLRVEHPEASEALAFSVVRVLSERFDDLDARLTRLMAESSDHHRANEWAAFRARLFEEPAA